MNLNLLTWILLVLPLCGGSIAGFFHQRLGRVGVQIITTSSVAFSCLLSLLLSWYFWEGTQLAWQVKGFTWYLGQRVHFSLGLKLDPLSLVMATLVTFVSLLVHIYSVAYMQKDPGYRRFFSYISLFTFAMLVLVTADNLLQLFFGWEAVGLMSYLLISFWFQKPEAIQGSFKAFLVNRMGDFGFLLGIALLFKEVGSVNYEVILNAIPHLQAAKLPLLGMQCSVLNAICVLLFIGAMGKSAQMPLHVWLPESMAGPTPISALIHAATMVTAGIYMISRLSLLFHHAPWARTFILVVGATTALLTGLVALTQLDIKRVIAFSTLSQLGFMVAALGVSAYSFSIFHLVTHAFFKALLFLSAGSVILSVHHEQNIQKMGGLWKRLPITYACFLVGALALVALPPFSGFYSKEPIIEAVYHATFDRMLHPAVSYYAFYSLLCGTFLTALYTGRLFFLVFHGTPRTDYGKTLHEPSKFITLPLILFAIPSAVLGKWLASAIENGRCLGISVWRAHEASDLPSLGILPTVLGLIGLLITWFCYIKRPALPHYLAEKTGFLYRALFNHYGLDYVNQRFWVKGTWNLSTRLAQWDQACLDQKIVQGTARLVHRTASLFHKLHTGYLYHSVLTMVLGIFALLIFILIRT